MDELIYDHERAEVAEFLPDGAQTMLDVGCGGGGFGRTIRAWRPDIVITGVEPYEAAASVARDTYDEVVIDHFPSTSGVLAGRTFDVIFFNDVLEHMADPQTALESAVPLLAPGGSVIASIPNIRHFSVIWDLVRYGTWTYADRGILDRTHVRFFTKSSMIELFREAGFKVLSSHGINRARWPEAGVDTWKTRGLSTLTRRRSDQFFFTQYVLIAQPA